MNVSDITWDEWQPRQKATLLFVIEGHRILLIHKKRGLGAGTINGPGGRIEPGETPVEAAVRETREELGIHPHAPEHAGVLHFQFIDGLSIHVEVFRSPGYTGTERETDEAVPLWTPVDQIPYDRMWEDDRYWIPLLLEGTFFKGFFTFDGSRMLDYRIVRPGRAET